MDELQSAFAKAGANLMQPNLFWHAVWPALLAICGLSILAVFSYVLLLSWYGWWLNIFSGLLWLAGFLFAIMLWSCFIALWYVTTVLLLVSLAFPHLLKIICQEYPELTHHGRRSAMQRFWHVSWVITAYSLGVLATLPLLLLPLIGFLQPVAWIAWLHKKCFSRETLGSMATPTELVQIAQTENSRLWQSAAITALPAFIPLLQLLVPGYTLMVMMHLELAALRRLRSTEGIML